MRHEGKLLYQRVTPYLYTVCHQHKNLSVLLGLVNMYNLLFSVNIFKGIVFLKKKKEVKLVPPAGGYF